jgi:MFS family permease
MSGNNQPASHQSTTSDLRNLFAACAAITVFGLAFGMTAPLLSLILAERNVSSDMIGLNAAMMPLGILLFSPVIPYLAEKFGARQVAIAAAVATALLIVAYKIFDSLGAWFVLRMVNGMSIATLFVLSEAWIVGSSGSAHRGKIVAIYASILSASFAAGPFLIGVIGVDGWMPFLIGAAAIAVGTIPIFGIREITPSANASEHKLSGPVSFTRKAPILVAAVGCFAILDSASISLLPVYGIENNLTQREAAFALTALIIGNIFLQPPIGWLADHVAPRTMFMALAAITIVAIAVLPWVLHTSLFWPALVIAGSAGYGVYTVSLKSLGDRFDGQELITGSATFSLVWGLGALLGAVSGGWSIRISSLYGLPFLLAGVYVLFLAGNYLRRKSQRALSENNSR